MDNAVESVLEEFHQRAASESTLMRELSSEEFDKRIDEFLLSVGPATGQLLHLLISGAGSQTVVEIGASYGYSTIWMADAARATGGRLISLEVHEGKQAYARDAVARAGLDQVVDFRLGDAQATLAELDMSVDFVLLDLWKRLYIPCFELIYPKLRADALVAADNMTYPPDAQKRAADYRAHVRAKSDIESVLLPVGSGIELSRKIAYP